MQVTWGFEQHYEGVVSDQQRPKCVLEPVSAPGDFIRSLLDGLLRNVTALKARFGHATPCSAMLLLRQQARALCWLTYLIRSLSYLVDQLGHMTAVCRVCCRNAWRCAATSIEGLC